MNTATVRTIAESMSIMDLIACAPDVITWQDTDKLPDGALRAFAARLKVEAGVDDMSSLAIAETSVLRESTLRLIVSQTGLRADQR